MTEFPFPKSHIIASNDGNRIANLTEDGKIASEFNIERDFAKLQTITERYLANTTQERQQGIKEKAGEFIEGQFQTKLSEIEKIVDAVLDEESIKEILIKEVDDTITTLKKEMLQKLNDTIMHDVFSTILDSTDKIANANLRAAPENAIPDGTKFLRVYGVGSHKTWTYVIEQKPKIRTLRWDNENFRLQLPYVIFMITFHANGFYQMKVFFRDKPLKNIKNDLLRAPLPNLSAQDCSVCTGTMIDRIHLAQNTNNSHDHVCEAAIEAFWASDFLSDHWGDAYVEFARKAINGVNHTKEVWRDKTANDPGSLLHLPWRNIGPVQQHLLAAANDTEFRDIVGATLQKAARDSQLKLMDYLRVQFNESHKANIRKALNTSALITILRQRILYFMKHEIGIREMIENMTQKMSVYAGYHKELCDRELMALKTRIKGMFRL